MREFNKHWGIVGGGILGMQLARRLVQQGDRVTIVEASNTPGGLTAAWQSGDIQWDKYYHVILFSDLNLRNLLEELELEKEIKWVETKTGFYTDGKLYSLSDSWEFLKFPPLSIIDKLRLAFTIFYASRIKNWQRLEKIDVSNWLKRFSGTNTFHKIWRPLLSAKLGEAYQYTSAAFIWATIQRMYAARRTGLKTERFGYVHGGYARILKKFTHHLFQLGVQMHTGFQVASVYKDGDYGVHVADHQKNILRFDEVILTVPSHIASKLCKDLGPEENKKHLGIEYLGVVCASLLLRKSVSPFYVTNITDVSPFTGIIEMTNLVDKSQFGGRTLVYLPKYMKKSDPVYSWSDDKIKKYFWKGLQRLHPHLTDDDLISFQISRAPHVFTLSTIGYSTLLPEVSTTIEGVHILNSAHVVNGTLNVNEILQLADRELPGIVKSSNRSQPTIYG